MPAGQRDDQPPLAIPWQRANPGRIPAADRDHNGLTKTGTPDPLAIAVAPETVPRAVPFMLHGTNDPVTPNRY
jgi:hypothetical protein